MAAFVRFQSAEPIDSKYVHIRVDHVSGVYVYDQKVEIRTLGGNFGVVGELEQVVATIANAIDEGQR